MAEPVNKEPKRWGRLKKNKGVPKFRIEMASNCVDGKKGYANKRSAKAALTYMLSRGLQCPPRPFKCSICGHYHLGHPPKGVARDDLRVSRKEMWGDAGS